MSEPFAIGALVPQTVVLLAQLSTTDGVRSPLSHVADEVFFLGLVEQLENQGLGKKIIANMLGLPRRPYPQTFRAVRCAVRSGLSCAAS